MNSRKNKKMVKSLKDYIVPIIGAIVFLFILYSVFSGGDAKEPTTVQNPIEIQVDPLTTQAYIEYAGGKKTLLENNTATLYPGEKVNLSTVGSVKMVLGANETLHLNKLGNILYAQENRFTLYTSDLFVQTSSPKQFDMRYMEVISSGENQVFNLTQTELSSSVYVLHGSVQVKNTAGVSVMVGKGERLTIVRNDAGNKDIDLNAKKEMIDEYIKTDEWYLLNNGNTFLTLSENIYNEASGTGTEERPVAGGFGYVQFDLLDESDVDTDTIDITGEMLDDIVYKIEINGQTAETNISEKTFQLKGLKLTARVNDIVYRVFDERNSLLDKGVLTVYYSKGTVNTAPSSQSQGLATVENYSLASSPLYTIVAPKSNPYITTENNVRLEGMVPARTVERIVINDFQLQRFPRHGTYWYYFANAEFGNLKEGLNLYKIQYYGAENKLLYENTFTIIKEAPKAPPVVAPPVVEESQPVVTEENTESAESMQE